ncbi:hypothetical protein [Polymorphobacter sp.]|uniref:hypothetical protein n=1 Tax=Polymorphobacter sp. TaxID=1909290 RepID=UPI003F728540
MHRSAILAALLFSTPSRSQPALPDPAGIAVPDLSGSAAPDVVANGWKYFVFRKAGISFAKAHDDMTDCARHLRPAIWANVMLPRFVPWQRSTATRTITIVNPYGLVGDLMLGAIEGTLIRRDRQSKMRRCLEPRGYIRYGIAEEIWENITALPADQSVAVMAKIAAGPDFGGKVPIK